MKTIALAAIASVCMGVAFLVFLVGGVSEYRRVVESVPSPDGRWTASIIYISRGATDSGSMRVILSEDSRVERGKELYVARDFNGRLAWRDTRTLVLHVAS